MSKRTAAVLVGGLISLVVYIAITVAALVKDLDSMSRPDINPADVVAQGPSDPNKTQVQLNENRADSSTVQAKHLHRRRIRPVSHHSKRMKQEAISLWLQASVPDVDKLY